jgi:hypothetical protein
MPKRRIKAKPPKLMMDEMFPGLAGKCAEILGQGLPPHADAADEVIFFCMARYVDTTQRVKVKTATGSQTKDTAADEP